MSRDISVDKPVGVSVSVSVIVSSDVSVDFSEDPSVGDRGFIVGVAMENAVEIAVEITMASVMGLHCVPLLVAAFRGGPWNVSGIPWRFNNSQWSVRGYTWNAVDIAVGCHGGARTLPRYSPKQTEIYVFELLARTRSFDDLCSFTYPLPVRFVPSACFKR